MKCRFFLHFASAGTANVIHKRRAKNACDPVLRDDAAQLMSGNSQQRQIEQTESLRQPVVFQCCACQHRHARNIKTKQRRVLGQQLLVTFHFFCRTLTIFFDGKIRLSFGRCLVHITRSKISRYLRASRQDRGQREYSSCEMQPKHLWEPSIR